MNCKLVQPHDYLKRYVRYFWILEGGSNGCAPTTFVALPDGCPGMIFGQAEEGTFSEFHDYKLPEVFLYGQTTKHTEIRTAGKFNTIGVYFYPDAVKSIFGFSAVEITNTCLDVDLTSKKTDYNLSERLLNASSQAHQIELISGYLINLITKNRNVPDDLTQHAVSKMISSNGNITLKELQQDLRLSERSFERRFNQHIGISPKLFSRVCRFQASLSQLRNNKYNILTDVAFENGYADQSHFIRSFKEFTGFSPEQYQKQSNELVENFPELIK